MIILSGVLVTSMPDICFLVDEQSKAWTGVPASAGLQAGAGTLSKADCTAVNLTLDICAIKVNFVQTQYLKFIVLHSFH